MSDTPVAQGISITHEAGRVVVRLHGLFDETLGLIRLDACGGLRVAEQMTDCTRTAIVAGGAGPSGGLH